MGDYVKAGAEWIILALRGPFDVEGLHIFMALHIKSTADHPGRCPGLMCCRPFRAVIL